MSGTCIAVQSTLNMAGQESDSEEVVHANILA